MPLASIAATQLPNLRSPEFAKRAIMNLSDAFLRRSFRRQQSATAFGLTPGCVTMLSDSQAVLPDGCHQNLLNRVTKNCQILLKTMSQNFS